MIQLYERKITLTILESGYASTSHCGLLHVLLIRVRPHFKGILPHISPISRIPIIELAFCYCSMLLLSSSATTTLGDCLNS